MSQSIVTRIFGAKVTIFGDGPDGGREASWAGDVPGLGVQDQWNGYGVLQAKYKTFESEPAKNLSWLQGQITSELEAWAKPDSKRVNKPKYILFTTNVRLSPVPGSGKDAIKKYVSEEIDRLKLHIQDFRIMDMSDISSLLDDSESIRRRYSAFITTGDVLNALLDANEGGVKLLKQALYAYTARTLRDESPLNLTQAGTAGENSVTIEQVFFDLPAELPVQVWLDQKEEEDRSDGNFIATAKLEAFDVDSEGDVEPLQTHRTGIAAHLINDFNYLPEQHDGQENRSHHRTVLVGGPGQGKSTVTQWLAQMYRCAFLNGSAAAKQAEVAAIVEKTDSRRIARGIPTVTARRWPVRIVLTDLADYLAKNDSNSLLHYIAEQISHRSSVLVDSLMLRDWLLLYPWLLLIDGLDEVPASSNRNQVMNAIQDFFVDVATLEADVAAVATTRPQGYSDEFSPKEYRHFNLSSLTVEESLDYAEGLVAVRVGEGTPNATKVMDRLRRASEEEHTSRLFESPLQVTILEVLLEKLGKAPTDRSRLYSSYYSVISQREQEKSGALSDLLQRYESDVHYLHRRVGYVLQQRGSEIGETSSYLSLEEFNGFIIDRFTSEGHSSSVVDQLATEFSTLVTDRLVFLAKLQADRFGFELRSLQEFMAGEYIVNRPENEVIGLIQRIAVSPYWRNVVLFAAGSIFSHREHLRAELVLMCEAINTTTSADEMILPGSSLALDILRDGSCVSMPRYSDMLANNALKLIETPSLHEVESLLFLVDGDLSSRLWAKIEISAETDITYVLNAALLLAMLSAKHDERARAALKLLILSVSRQAKNELVLLAWRQQNLVLGELLTSYVGDSDLGRLFSETTNRTRLRMSPHRSKNAPDWMRHLGAVSNLTFNPLSHLDSGSNQKVYLTGQYEPLRSEVSEAWTWFEETTSKDSRWVAFRNVASFANKGTVQSLIACLETVSQLSIDRMPNATPWPLVACLRYVDRSIHNAPTFAAEKDASRAAYTSLIRAASDGHLGTRDDWISAQNRWGERIAIDASFVAQNSVSHELPLWKSLVESEVSLSALTIYADGLDESAQRLELAELISVLIEASKSNDEWFGVALFLSGMMAISDVWQDDPTAAEVHLSLSAELANEVLGRSHSGQQWITWLNLMSISPVEPSDALLEKLGHLRRPLGSLSASNLDAMQLRINGQQEFAELWRLVLTSDPGRLANMSTDDLRLFLDTLETLERNRFSLFVQIREASSLDYWNGSLTQVFIDICFETVSSWSVNWFHAYVRSLEPEGAADLGAAIAAAVRNYFPFEAETFLRTARQKSAAASLAVSELG